MVSIEAFCAKDDATAWYRVKFPLQALAEKGLVQFKIHYGEDLRPSLDKPDYVVFQRTVTQESLDLFQRFKGQGVKCIYDLDDDLPHLDKTNIAQLILGHDRNKIVSHHEALRNPQNAYILEVLKDYAPLAQMNSQAVCDFAQGNFGRAIRFVRECDLLTVTNVALKKTYSGWGARHIQVLNNYEKAGEWKNMPRAPLLGRVVLGWAGGLSHAFTDIKPIAGPVARAMKRNSELHLHIIGVPEMAASFINQGAPRERVFTEPYQGWEKYKELVTEFDVTLAPSFGETKFARGKSTIRVTQGWMNGIPCVASPLTYGDLVNEVKGGLVAQTASEWEEAIVKLGGDGDYRRELGAQGKGYSEAHTYENECARWLEAYKCMTAL